LLGLLVGINDGNSEGICVGFKVQNPHVAAQSWVISLTFDGSVEVQASDMVLQYSMVSIHVGLVVGIRVGDKVGIWVGTFVGLSVGAKVGPIVRL